ncbi:hypothetical protein [Neobacillus mesonae]|uniref:hypothetical protein n=1 Tax=Neobacillus mesonae TaxID=1193713 RepID=UPI0025725383|nr:hypothetical protein [Neobacillus mesonae]
MTNIHDFQKAIEQKKKRVEMKEKHTPASRLLEKEVIQLLEQSGVNQQFKDFGEEFLKAYKELGDKYENVIDKYSDLSTKYSKLADMTEGVINRYDHLSYLYILVEHFIAENELADEFIDFLKEVAENEKVDDYRNAAKKQVDSYHFEYEGQEYYELDYQYMPSWEKFNDEEEMEEAN